MAARAPKVKPPKYYVKDVKSLLLLLQTSLRGQILQLPKGCTHVVYSPYGDMDGMTAAWDAGGSTLETLEVEVEGAEVIFTDAWGVECLRKGDFNRQHPHKSLQLLLHPQGIESKTRVMRPRRDPGQSDLGIISDAILSQSRRITTERMKPDPRPTEERTQLKPAAFFVKGIPPSGKKAMACINDNGRLLKWEPKTAGYWRQVVNYTADDTLPFPVITTAKGYFKSEFLNQLEIAEKAARRKNYRGWSNNRWDGTANGSSEFNLKGWTWPDGYSTYLKAGVLPSREFYRFIMGKDLETLPSYSKENV